MIKKQQLNPTSGFSESEERANMLTHAIGVPLSIAGLTVAVVLASLRGDAYLIVACAVYGVSLVLLHLASSLYHGTRDLRWKTRFLAMDHSCIYVLIAGTYTPFALGPLRGPVGWTMFGIIWSLALVGIIREIWRPQRGTWFSTGIYLVMGWMILLVCVPLFKALSTSGLILLVVGGLLYSVGTLFYKWHSLKFHHAVWHLFVVAAATCQFFAVLTVVAD